MLYCFLSPVVFGVVFTSYFRGDQLEVKRPDNVDVLCNLYATAVEFRFRLSWAIGTTGCSTSSIDNLTSHAHGWWSAIDTNQNTTVISDVNYICTTVSIKEGWEIGEQTFTYNFTTKGPYTIRFRGGAWIYLAYGNGNGIWNVETSVDLNERSDTNNPNTSPVTSSRAMYRIQLGCPVSLKIPLIDTEGDIVRCRWATPKEAASISRLLPNALLDEASCTIIFLAIANNNYTSSGWYAVALTIEDFPRNKIDINGRIYTPSTPLSQVPLQFLIRTETMLGSCNEKPTFVPSSPVEGSVLRLNALETLHIRYYVHSAIDLVSIDIYGLTGLLKSSINPDDLRRTNVSFVDVSWTPQQSSQDTYIICSTAEDINGKLSDTQCFSALIVQGTDFCRSSPCNDGCTCKNNINSFTCDCPGACEGKLNAKKETQSLLESNNAICTEYFYGLLCHIICFIVMLLMCVQCMVFIYLRCKKNKVKPQLKSITCVTSQTRTRIGKSDSW